MTVTGTGSQLSNSSGFFVGYGGSGTLAIANGGTVNSSYATIGQNNGSMGVVTVNGGHSTWNAPSVSESLCVGYNGNGMMTITNGGTVNDQRASCSIGSGSASTGTVAVDGAGSTWSSYEALDVGGRGNATLNVTNGGVVTSQSGLLGNMTGSTGSATISGSGSTWTATLGVTVGGAGDGKLRIDGGGTVNSPSDVPGAAASYIAQGYNSMSTVAVDGAGSTWTNGANLVSAPPGPERSALPATGPSRRRASRLAARRGRNRRRPLQFAHSWRRHRCNYQ